MSMRRNPGIPKDPLIKPKSRMFRDQASLCIELGVVYVTHVYSALCVIC